jgi:hypothetical protein
MPADTPVHFHEDDYCQIELLPRSTWKFCAQQLGIIADFADAHRAGDSYTDMYVRPDAPIALADLHLLADDADRLLASKLPRHRSVTTGYSTHVEPVPRTIAYGASQSCCLFVQANQAGTVRAAFLQLWGAQPPEVEALHAALGELARTADLLLVDWERRDLLALSDNAALRDYLARVLTPEAP